MFFSANGKTRATLKASKPVERMFFMLLVLGAVAILVAIMFAPRDAFYTALNWIFAYVLVVLVVREVIRRLAHRTSHPARKDSRSLD